MKYFNKKTQVVIDTPCICSGGDWEAVHEAKKPKNKKPPVKKTTKKGDE